MSRAQGQLLGQCRAERAPGLSLLLRPVVLGRRHGAAACPEKAMNTRLGLSQPYSVRGGPWSTPRRRGVRFVRRSM